MDKHEIQKLKDNFVSEANKVVSWSGALKLKAKYLGVDGEVKNIFKSLANVVPQERKEFGALLNTLKQDIESWVSEAQKRFSQQKEETPLEVFYATLPGVKPRLGHLNIITQAIKEITDIFKPLGFKVIRGQEVDWDYYVFESLNMPKTHPARDEWETFFISAPDDSDYGRMVITPHTSNAQIREMQKGELPIRMLAVGRCGRRQSDLTHLQSFYQFEGLVIDKGINITHLKGVLDYFVKNFFGPDRVSRLRPHHFQFTEPSFEVDISCGLCKGKGCRFCKAGWVELGGAGMVHPNVLKAGEIDYSVYTGFAFGWGIERTYMMKVGTNIDDIRRLFENDLRFLEQF
ncbi:MAG: phenylalanine--tRNA ligase subunit alpha [Candidatus Portnoybacteria bacterium CG10_big_fil_rev_8_21_14_0_10_36_7]|uniref:Phenylalanine--tRNA ligase alpha subunit n=1 Tax=Candidatus Portnoybacteria bacterium CG10_big_fil_rev_8_21_14_0_10_36_7 TaxID=1974812 RepID=A0A2M8KEK4_9BACT|nr:MAG: phenylalanine--tRNA ligase subunit alpha [Candidatus Portnoybacteria bacterium CG10_big_fil_rev_8_21_14_0_10_36_7]